MALHWDEALWVFFLVSIRHGSYLYLSLFQWLIDYYSIFLHYRFHTYLLRVLYDKIWVFIHRYKRKLNAYEIINIIVEKNGYVYVSRNLLMPPVQKLHLHAKCWLEKLIKKHKTPFLSYNLIDTQIPPVLIHTNSLAFVHIYFKATVFTVYCLFHFVIKICLCL